jgi:hypothetical protein
MTIPEAIACHPTNREANGALAMQVDSFVPTRSAFGFPIYVAPLSAGSVQRACQDILDFIQVPGYPSSIHVSHSRTLAVKLFNSSRGLSLSRWAGKYIANAQGG